MVRFFTFGLLVGLSIAPSGVCWAETFEPSNDQMELIVEVLSERMRDPESTRVREVVANTDPKIPDASWVCGKVSAKNAFGGYGDPLLFMGSLFKGDSGKEGFLVIAIEDDSGASKDRLLNECVKKLTQ